MFFVSVCNKQMKVCCFVYRLQQTNGNCRFPFFPFFCECEYVCMFIYAYYIRIYTYMPVHTNTYMKNGTNRNGNFYLYICIYLYLYVYHIYIYGYGAVSKEKRKTEARAIFINPCTICSSCKWKFIVCPSVDKDTNGSYPFANGLNRLNGLSKLAHLCSL
jgi:hypothetical protein